MWLKRHLINYLVWVIIDVCCVITQTWKKHHQKPQINLTFLPMMTAYESLTKTVSQHGFTHMFPFKIQSQPQEYVGNGWRVDAEFIVKKVKVFQRLQNEKR